MADKLPMRSLRGVILITIVAGFGLVAAFVAGGVSLSSLFSGLRGDGPSQAIDDDLGDARAGRYVAEGEAQYGSAQWVADNSRFDTEPSDRPIPTPEPQTSPVAPAVPDEPNVSIAGMDPTAAAIAQLNAGQSQSPAQPRSTQPLSDELRAILEAQWSCHGLVPVSFEQCLL